MDLTSLKAAAADAEHTTTSQETHECLLQDFWHSERRLGTKVHLKMTFTEQKERTYRRLQRMPRRVGRCGSKFVGARYVHLANYNAFLKKVATRPSAVVSGATLMKGAPFASPYADRVAEEVGRELGKSDTQVAIMATGTFRGHCRTVSFDHDVSKQWAECVEEGRLAVHFKGTNQVPHRAWPVIDGPSLNVHFLMRVPWLSLILGVSCSPRTHMLTLKSATRYCSTATRGALSTASAISSRKQKMISRLTPSTQLGSSSTLIPTKLRFQPAA